MSALFQPATRRRVTLDARTVLGRSRKCDLTVPHPSISSEHAVLWWQDDQWWIRDLGSRNGTTVDDREVGEAKALEVGAVIKLGTHPLHWVLESASPPLARAVHEESGRERLAESGLLALPDPETPSALLYLDSSLGWQLESGDEGRTVTDQEVISVLGESWRLYLPQGQAATLDARSTGAVEELSLHFALSRDEEHLTVTGRAGGRTLDLGSRAHHHLLLILARARVEDQDEAESSQGWRYMDDVARMVGVNPERLNMLVYRARKQLAEAELSDARNIVERRSDTRQMRLGIAAVTLTSI